MKKQLLSVIAASSVFTAFAQLPVSTTVQHKKAVLEEFTGIYCGYCPDGHRLATNFYNADPANVVLINIHSGPFANVNVGEPDFTTVEGTAIDGMTGTDVNNNAIAMGITGYPAGDINRRVWSGPQTAGGMAGGRASWTSWGTSVKTETAYCNIALQGTIDVTTRILTVVAAVYYTGTSPSPINHLNICLLEDSVTGPQHNYGAATFGPGYYNYANYNADESYNHNHVLRKAITGSFGEAINTTSMGTTYTTSATYNIPLTYGATGKTNPCALGNLKLVAFVTETDISTINGAHGPLTLTNYPHTNDIGTTNFNSEASVCASTDLNPTLKFMNYGSTPVTAAVLSYAVNGGTPSTYNWTGNVHPQTPSETIDLPVISFVPVTSGSNTLTVNVVSVNGSTDDNAANDVSTKSIGLPPIAQTLTMTMNFTQDRYGSEDSWGVYNEVTGDSIAGDGPFSDLTASGTLLHTLSFEVDPATCYQLIVRDAYGDGTNGGYGVGGYVLKSGTANLITSNGAYGTGETKLYKSAGTATYTGIQSIKMNVRSVNLYPNPTNGVANLSIELTQNENVSVTVMNSIGQQVYTVKSKNLDAGVNVMPINTENWAGGVYFINVSSPKGSLNQKLTVTK
jgi:hypothetical protein